MRAADFVFENRWILLTALSTLSLLYVALKNKFTDETFIKFQEEELYNIMTIHKELWSEDSTSLNILLKRKALKEEKISAILQEYSPKLLAMRGSKNLWME